MLGYCTVAPAKHVEAEAIARRVDLFDQSLPDSDPLGRLDVQLEDGVLNPLAEISAQFRDSPQSSLTASAGYLDVVADQNAHMGSFPKEGRISVEIASQVAREQLRLRVWNHTHWDLLV